MSGKLFTAGRHKRIYTVSVSGTQRTVENGQSSASEDYCYDESTGGDTDAVANVSVNLQAMNYLTSVVPVMTVMLVVFILFIQ